MSKESLTPAKLLALPDDEQAPVYIDLNFRISECAICEEMAPRKYYLPMYEGEVVSDDWKGEWGGFHVCERCYFKHRPEEHFNIVLRRINSAAALAAGKDEG